MDGQQRLRACVDFIGGKFQIDGVDTPEWAGMRFEDLSEKDKKQIFNYSFVVRVLPEMPDEDLRSMFQRLNRNVVALNRQELRHATYWGEFIQTVEKLADDDRWSDMAIFTPNDVRPMLDIEYVSELAVAYLHGPQNKKDNLEVWYQTYEEEFEDKRDIETVFNAVLGEVNAVLPEIKKTRWRKKSDFYSLFLGLAKCSERMPLSSDVRDKLSKVLQLFGSGVDLYIRDSEGSANIGDRIKKYTAAVEKAASDLNNRKARQVEVDFIIETALADRNETTSSH